MNKIIGTLLGVAASLVLVGCAAVPSGGSAEVMTKAKQQSMTPSMVIDDLKAGNARYVSGKLTERDWLAKAATTAAEGQYPKAIVLSCLDSRVPTEVVFDQALGDIFVGRVAGNFENTDLLGSMEFGTKLAGAKAIVVLGHTECGAVKGAIAGAELGNLTETLANIRPAVLRAGQPGNDSAVFTQTVVIENVKQTVEDIIVRSPVIAEMVRNGELKVVGAWYDLETGKVHWL